MSDTDNRFTRSKCPQCLGKKVVWKGSNPAYDLTGNWVDCPRCNGTGLATYQNYGPGTPARTAIHKRLVLLRRAAINFSEKRAQTPQDKRYIAQVIDSLTELITKLQKDS